MVSILYCENDYEAANIALKVQSLAQYQPIQTYIVPKHYGRNEMEVNQKLGRTQAAIFIAFDAKHFDSSTANELNTLHQKKIPIKYVIPTDFDMSQFKSNVGNIHTYHAHSGNTPTIINDLSTTIRDLNNQLNQPNTIQPNSNSDTPGVAIALMAGLALLLLGIAASESKK